MIQPIPEPILSKIRAGEVIDSPAAVVRELLDNAIDSDATRVVVSVASAGLQRIQVEDNGKGIDASDLPVLGRKHYTGKLITDPYSIPTLGFRGEALASMATCADVKVLTSNGTDSWETTLDTPNRTRPLARAKGTTVFVDNLFRKLPAKLKFLPAKQALLERITRVFLQKALSKPDVTFQLIIDGTVHYTLSPATYQSRLTEIKPLDYTKTELLYHDLKVTLFSQHVRHTSRLNPFMLVNQRSCDNVSPLQSVVDSVLKERLSKNSKPFYLLVVETPSTKVDLHVHPSKALVNLALSQETLTSIRKDLKEKLKDLTPSEFAAPTFSPKEVLGWKWLHTDENTALFLEGRNLICLDLKEAFRNIFSTQLYKQMETRMVSTDALDIFLPVQSKQVQFLTQFQSSFAEQGLIYDFWGTDTLRVRTIPGIVPSPGNKVLLDFINHYFSYLSELQISNLAELSLQDLFKTANYPATPTFTTQDQIQSLLKDLFSLDNPLVGLSGKPTFKVTALSALVP